MQRGLVGRRRPEKPAAPRRVRPLVEVRGVEIDTQRRNVEGQRARGVRAVGENEHALLPAPRSDGGDGQDERALRGDVVDDEEPRPWPERGGHGIDETARIELRIGHDDGAHGGATLARDEGRHLRNRPVAVIGDEDLVARREWQGSQDRGGTGRCVVDEDEVLPTRPDEISHGMGGDAQSARRRPRTPTMPDTSRRTKREGCRSISSRSFC